MKEYQDFIANKGILFKSNGIDVAPEAIHPPLFPFQRDLVRWSVRKGRAALFADTGLGKTYMALEWARLLGQRTLIIAPLPVARQTVRMARDIGLEIHYTRDPKNLVPGINITNYEMLDQFEPDDFGAVVLDESSILKAFDGKTRKKLIRMFKDTPIGSAARPHRARMTLRSWATMPSFSV